MISLVRIDDRLLHGQVAYGWTPAVGANVILVVNDEAKNNQMKAMALDVAKPTNVALYIRSVEESGEIVAKFANSKKSNVLVLVKNSHDALQLIKNSNSMIKDLNVGGLPYSEGKRKLTELIAVDEQDIKNFHEMGQMGVEVECQMLPRDKKRRMQDLL